MHTTSSVHQFSSIKDAGFTAEDYSRLKFGSDAVAKEFGHRLAEDFFNKHSDVVLSQSIVVVPSPYNHVENAATIMTKHFVNRLNALSIENSGRHVEFSVIHRKVSYISDYGFLSKEKRKGLIDQDSFFLNKDFYAGKVLIFVDDVKITGTHEDKLVEVLDKNGIDNDCFFIYFGEYTGSNPKIEAALNFAGIKNENDLRLLFEEKNHHVIVRPIKYLLNDAMTADALHGFLEHLTRTQIENIYYGSLGEGYYTIPAYQRNFGIIKSFLSL
jgi:hypothetical protein